MKKELAEKFNSYRQGKSLKGTETEKNILKSFAGESQARNRYDMFAGIAREEGYQQIAAIFEETAHNEKHHAQIFFAFLEGDIVEIQASYPAGKMGSTLENLKASADGEHEEFADIYPTFAEVAEKEGFHKIASQFKLIAKVEKEHEERFRTLVKNLESNKVFEKEEKVFWVCRECGHIHFGIKAPGMCPTCLASQAYFEVKSNNY